MDEEIKDFLKKQKIATVCCVDEQGNPYCFSCFYSFNLQNKLLIFKSSATSRHIKLLLENPRLAGTILAEKVSVLPVAGIQFSGVLLEQPAPYPLDAANAYYKRFPLALTLAGKIYFVKLETIKMTNSRTILGKKVVWQRDGGDMERYQ
jgi:uncharacterized protein YhbP (UPF0306 family)